MTSRLKNAKRNMFWALINKVITMFLPFATRTAVIYFLGSLYLGLNALFSSILTILSLAELGFGSAMVFSMYEPIAKNSTLEVNALLNLYRKIYQLVGLIILVIGCLMLPFLKYFIKGEIPSDISIYALYIIYLLSTVLSYFLFAYKESVLIADQRNDVISNIATSISIATSTLQLLMLFAFKNYYLYVLILPLMTIIKNIMTNALVNKMYPQYMCEGDIESNTLSDIKKRVTGLFIYRVCYVFRDSFDSVILSAFLGLEVLAKYNNYYYIVITITGFLLIVKNSISASVGNSIVLENEDKNYQDFRKCQMLYMWLSGWCTVCLFCLLQPFIRIWLGDYYLFSNSIMALFCVYFYCYKMGDICALYRQSAGLWWEDRYRPIVESVVNLSLNIILVKIIGISGVMLSTIICLVFINSIWASRVLYKKYFLHQKQRDYIFHNLYFAIITTLSCYITGSVCDYVHLDGFIVIFVRGLLCCTVPNIIMLFSYKCLPEYTDSINFIKKMLYR